MGLYTIPTTDLFNAFRDTLGVGYDYMTPCFDLNGNRMGTCGTLAVGPIIDLTGWLGKPFLHLVQSPFGVFTMGKYFPEVLYFFMEKMDCYCPRAQSISQHADAGQLNILPQQQPITLSLTKVMLD